MHWGELITIIVPIYNVEKYLNKCIESLIHQTYSNLEIILVDDGSTDGSSSICDEYASMDRRIKVLHKKNAGVMSARKAGADQASGEYVVSVDGDDWIDLDRINNLAKKIVENECDIIYMTGIWKEYEDKSVLCENSIQERVFSREEIVKEFIPLIVNTNRCFEKSITPSMGGVATKRDLHKTVQREVDEQISQGDDQAFLWLCLLQANSVAVIQESGYHYLQRNGSITHLANESSVHGLQIMYQQIKKKLDYCNSRKEMYNALVFFIMRDILISNYECLCSETREYLYPYTKVIQNSRVAIYGAGKVGIRLIQALKKTRKYEVALWVDKSSDIKFENSMKVCAVEELINRSFDFVVIAVIDEKLAKEISKNLISMGIDEKKIALMDREVITEQNLPKDFLDHK